MNHPSPPAHGAASVEMRDSSRSGAHRIVSLVPAATEWLTAFGAGDRIVGRTDRCDNAAVAHARVVAEGLPAHPAFETDAPVRIDVDAIAGLQPGLVIADSESDEGHGSLAAAVPAAAIVVFAPTTFKQVLDRALALGRAAGASRDAMAWLADAERRLWLARNSVGVGKAPTTGRRVALLHGAGSVRAGGLWCADLIELAGGTPVMSVPGAPPTEVSASALAAAHPDVIIDATSEGIAPHIHADSRGTIHRFPSDLPILDAVPDLYRTALYLIRIVAAVPNR